MVTPEEVIKRSLDPDNAAVSRDGLAKTIYCRLFDWYYCYFCTQIAYYILLQVIMILRVHALLIIDRLVDKINNSIGQDPNSKSLIGVLDIYGFESFKSNR